MAKKSDLMCWSTTFGLVARPACGGSAPTTDKSLVVYRHVPCGLCARETDIGVS